MFHAMHLKLQTDYALRVLLYLGYAEAAPPAGPVKGGNGAAPRAGAPVDAMAGAFGISREHLVKVVQELARKRLVRTRPGRAGGVELLPAGRSATVAEVVAHFEGRRTVLPCVLQPQVCVLEPGCDLRRLLMSAEEAFYAALADTTIAELCQPKSKHGGLRNLRLR